MKLSYLNMSVISLKNGMMSFRRNLFFGAVLVNIWSQSKGGLFGDLLFKPAPEPTTTSKSLLRAQLSSLLLGKVSTEHPLVHLLEARLETTTRGPDQKTDDTSTKTALVNHADVLFPSTNKTVEGREEVSLDNKTSASTEVLKEEITTLDSRVEQKNTSLDSRAEQQTTTLDSRVEQQTTSLESRAEKPTTTLIPTPISIVDKKQETGAYRLKGIRDLVTPSLLYSLAASGYGDHFVMASSNFPSERISEISRIELIQLPGTSIAQVLKEVLKLLPVCHDEPVIQLDMGDGDTCEHDSGELVTSMIATSENASLQVKKLPLKEFFEEASKAYSIIATGDLCLSNSIIFAKGDVSTL